MSAMPAWQHNPDLLAWGLTVLNLVLALPAVLFSTLYSLAVPPPPAPKDVKTVLITGATSGIGKALAIEYARAGVTLLLTGRNQERLAGVAADCTSRGAAVVTKALDITDRAATERWVLDMDAAHCVDMAIANAGVSISTSGQAPDSTAEVTRALFAANVDGVFSTLLPLVAPMKARKRGQLVIMSSQASFSAMNSFTYNATKGAVRMWGEGLRHDLAAWGIAVNVICPGFVKSPMTDVNTFPMPGIVEMPAAVSAIVAGLAANTPVITFPAITFLAAAWLGGLPPAVRHALAASRCISCLRTRRSTKPRLSVGAGGSK